MAQYSAAAALLEAAGRSQVALPEHAKLTFTMARTVAVDTALALNDTIQFGMLPKDARIVEAALISDQLDSGTTITFDVGDALLATRIFSAAVVGRTAGGSTNNNFQVAAIAYLFPAKTMIFGTVHAAATTKVAGNITLVLKYEMNGNPTSP